MFWCMVISFKARPYRSGNSYVVVLPKALVTCGVLSIEKKYKITVEEVD